MTLTQPPAGGSPAGSFTLTAGGGRVPSYTIIVPPAYAAGLSVTPASGSLAAGQSVTITVTWKSSAALSAQLAVTPGPVQVGVSYQPIG